MMHPLPDTLRDCTVGACDFTTRLLVEAHLTLCATCAHLVCERREPQARSFEAINSDEIELPSFTRIWAAVERAEARRRTPEVSVVPVAVLVALPEPVDWHWTSLWPQRVKFALLTRDIDTASALYLSYYAPQSRFPRHRHVGLEESVILAGGYQNGDVHVEAGDWAIGAPGTEHTPETGPDESCWCLSRIERPGLRFLWMARLVAAVSSVAPPDWRSALD